MSRSYKDRRRHRRKVAGKPQGLREHSKRDQRQGEDRRHKPAGQK